jgi:ADP-ribose pyrophosphatase
MNDFHIVCATVVVRDGKILMIQEAKKEAYKKWWLPAGKLDKGETIFNAAIRETKEETGYEVALENMLCVISPSNDRPLMIIFQADIVSGDIVIDPKEILDVKWIPLDEVMQLNLRAPKITYEILQILERGEKYPLDIVKEVK